MAWKKYIRKQKKRAVNWAKKRYTGPGAVKNIVKDVSMLKSLINTESKYYELLSVAASPTVTAPYIVGLNDLATGNTAITRNGNSIKMRSNQMSMRIERNPTTASPDANTVVVSLVLDKDPNVGALDPAGVWNSADTEALRSYEVEFQNRYKILAQKRFTLDGVNTKTAVCRWFKKLYFHTRFNGTTGTSQTNNKLYLVVRTDSTIVGDVDIFFHTRTKFIDN